MSSHLICRYQGFEHKLIEPLIPSYFHDLFEYADTSIHVSVLLENSFSNCESSDFYNY